MWADVHHAGERRINKVDVITPLIAPSFSSRRFPEVKDIHEDLKDKLYGVCLVSASDLAKGSISSEAIGTTNLVFVDSGVYESSDNWREKQYRKILRGIDEQANVIAVNFDRNERLDVQISRASEDFTNAPTAASNFLLKPVLDEGRLNIARLKDYALDLSQFGIIGVAAREIGDSFLQRCSSIVMLRDILRAAGLDTPIHVFGAITLPEILTYFFCGADIFDGLNWLSYAYRRHGHITFEDAAAEEMKWRQKDYELRLTERIGNLNLLYNLQVAMQHYCRTGDMDGLVEDFPPASKAKRIAQIAGAAIR